MKNMRKTVKRAATAGSKRPRSAFGGMKPGLGWGPLASMVRGPMRAATRPAVSTPMRPPTSIASAARQRVASKPKPTSIATRASERATSSSPLPRAIKAARGGERKIVKRLSKRY